MKAAGFRMAAERNAHRVCALGLLFLLLAGVACQRPAVAQPPVASAAAAHPDLQAKLQRRGSIALRDMTLPQALFAIGAEWQVNVVVGNQVEGHVNGAFQDAPLHEILDAVLLANGFSYRPVGQSLVVMSLEGLGDVNPQFTAETITLRQADVTQLVEGAALLSSPHGKVKAVPASRSLLVVDYPDRVERIRRFAQQVDQATVAAPGHDAAAGPLQVAHFKPQYVQAVSLNDAVASLLSEHGKSAAVEAENVLVVVDHAAVLTQVEQLVQQIDQPRPQVKITALIYDMSVDDMKRVGFNWSHAVKGSPNADGEPRQQWAFDTLLQAPIAASDPSGVMTFMTMSEHFDLTTVLDLFKGLQDTRLLADPTVAVVDREPATIQIVREIPYQQLTQTDAGGQIGSTAFREAGITLVVTPQVANDETILLDVKPTFSRFAGFTEGDAQQPIIDKREAQTMVRVANRQTLVIGGLRQRDEVEEFRGVPGLMEIEKWHLGSLFRWRSKSVRESELVVFLYSEVTIPNMPHRCRDQQAMNVSRQLLDCVPTANPLTNVEQHYPPHCNCDRRNPSGGACADPNCVNGACGPAAPYQPPYQSPEPAVEQPIAAPPGPELGPATRPAPALDASALPPFDVARLPRPSPMPLPSPRMASAPTIHRLPPLPSQPSTAGSRPSQLGAPGTQITNRPDTQRR